MNDVKKKKVLSSALAEHAEKTHHGFDWDQASVIAREKNWMKRHYLESLTIQTGNTLNRITTAIYLLRMQDASSDYFRGFKLEASASQLSEPGLRVEAETSF